METISELIDEPILEIGDIQGNIFPGFMKNYQMLLGLKILDGAENIKFTKNWIASIAPEIATAEEVLKFKELRNLMLDRRSYLSGKLSVCWINIAFSVQGLKKLANPKEVDQFEDDGFKQGLPVRASSIGDPDDSQDLEGSPKNWKIGRIDKIPDIFLIIASDLQTQLEATVEQIKNSLKQTPTSVDEPAITSGLEIIYEELGENLPEELNLSGHEHFGFKDGISQPGIRGLLSKEPPHNFLTTRYIKSENELSQTFSKPGQPLVWPGQFVFGYPAQSERKATESVPSKPAPIWAKNGSFLVFRRLRQDVGSFWKFMHSKAKELAAKDGFSDLDGERLAALLVGRWKSGAPIMRTPDKDNEQLSNDDFANNHFNFRQKSQQIPLIPGQPDDGYELAPEDRDGFRCPHAAHIRKVNPRDITTEQGSDTDTLRRRILRRGIPFGKVLDDPNNPDVDPLQGNHELYLSHMAMFTMEDHMYQVVLQVHLPPNITQQYQAYKQTNPSAIFNLINIESKKFTLPQLPIKQITGFNATIYQDYSNEGSGKPGEIFADNIMVEVERVVHFRHFDFCFHYPDLMTYIMFGNAQEAHIIHYFSQDPDFDHILTLASVPDWISPDQLQAGVEINIIGIPSYPIPCSSPLTADTYEVQFQGQSDHKFLIHLSKNSTIWFSTGNLLNAKDPCHT